jgi:hypothetical protein
MAEFDELIHAERGRLLRRLPKGAKTICSAGCAGTWYFNWVEEEYGHVDLHIGVELYSPRPDDLPSNVRWIQNSVSQMVDVQSASVDLLFSGQNIEHLYYEDLSGFLKEACRVVRDGGHLCIDSPNRSITQELGYTQPQHVLELSVPDAIELVEAAGFTVMNVFGIWNCADGLKRVDDIFSLSGDIEEQRASARDNPHTSFIWWLVAQKTGCARGDLERIVDKIVARAFQPFVAARFRKGIGQVHSIEGTETTIRLTAGEYGHAFYGPYIPLTPGVYTAEFDMKFLSDAGAVLCDVVAEGAAKQFREVTVVPSELNKWQKITLEFVVHDYTQGLETRVEAQGADALLRLGTTILRN